MKERQTSSVLARLRAAGITARLPRWVRKAGYCLLGGEAADLAMWRAQYQRRMTESPPPAPLRTNLKIGVITDAMYRFGYYESACRELGVPYCLIDITGDDWRNTVAAARCDIFVVWPYVQTAAGKALYDERVSIMEKELGMTVFPGSLAVWLYESKYRTAEWLQQNYFPTPQTFVFRNQADAEEFVDQRSDWPLLFKTDLGAEAYGIRILRDRAATLKLVEECFGRGIRLPRRAANDRERGAVMFQQFIPDAREWRMVRIGNSFFGRRKGKKGEFHSGSKIAEYDTPPRELLDLTRQVTDCGKFRSMSLDVLEDADGNYYIIELHAYFGCSTPHVMKIDGVPGRYVYNEAKGDYTFEDGDFNRNQSCNLRVEMLLADMELRNAAG